MNIIKILLCAVLLGSMPTAFAARKTKKVKKAKKVKKQQKSAKPKLTIKTLEAQDDVSKFKDLFVNFYSTLYKGAVAEKLKGEGKPDLNKELEERFEREAEMWRSVKQKLTALYVMDGSEVVAIAVLKKLSDDDIRLMRCSVNLQKDVEFIGTKVIEAVFKHYPNAKRIVNVVLKTSALEITMLKRFNFTETALVDATYDAALYTSYELKKPA